jgi:hypothetical protein
MNRFIARVRAWLLLRAIARAERAGFIVRPMNEDEAREGRFEQETLFLTADVVAHRQANRRLLKRVKRWMPKNDAQAKRAVERDARLVAIL